MIYKLFFLPIIVFFFTACGDVKTAETPIDNNDTIMVCKQSKQSNFYKNTIDSFQINAMDNLKLLVETAKPIQKDLTFDKSNLYKLFTTEYYWASLTSKTFDYSTYTNPQSLIDALKYRDDRWSFATTIEEYNRVMSQKSEGVGVRCQDFESGCLVTYVRIDSPADRIDLRRGDVITKIDGVVATERLFYEEVQKKLTLNLEIVRSKSNEVCNGNITPREYRYKVVDGKVLKSLKQERVGYLRLDSFLGDTTIENQINRVFDEFKRDGIVKLIIDLRYNGGGSVDLASKLVDKLAINHIEDEQFTLSWNSNYQNKNTIYRFKDSYNALNLKQIIFLTTKDSASASELVISAMKPYLPESDLVIIGDRTHGKPVGMEGRSDTNYYYFIINFVVKNSLGFYDYFEGLPVTSGCRVADDPLHEMGDVNEAMLKTALHYIDSGSCQ